MLKLKGPDFPNGGAPVSRVMGRISTAPIAPRLLSLEAGKTRAEVLWFTSSRNSKK